MILQLFVYFVMSSYLYTTKSQDPLPPLSLHCNYSKDSKFPSNFDVVPNYHESLQANIFFLGGGIAPSPHVLYTAKGLLVCWDTEMNKKQEQQKNQTKLKGGVLHWPNLNNC